MILMSGFTEAFVPVATTTVTHPILSQPFVRRIHVTHSGLLTIPFADLQASGWNSAVYPTATLRVIQRAQEVLVSETPLGVAILAQANDSAFTTETVYWLVSDGRTLGQRRPLPSHGPPLSWEQDRLFLTAVPTSRGDHWFAAEINATNPFTVNLQLSMSLPRHTRLQLSVTPLMPGPQWLALRHHDQLLATHSWYQTTIAPITLTLQLAQPLPNDQEPLTLLTGANTLAFDRLLAPDLPTTLLPLLPESIAIPALFHDLRHGPTSNQRGADSLIVVAPALLPAMPALLKLRQSQHINTAFVVVRDVFDQLSYGEPHPAAITELVRLAQNWNPTPRSLLLLGFGDPRLRNPDNAAALIPPLLRDTDPKYGAIACDTCFARIHGDHQPPIMAVGRLPARTLAEADLLIQKLVDYQRNPPHTWQHNAIFVADNDREPNGNLDPAGPFRPTLTQIARPLPTNWKQRWLEYDPSSLQPENHAVALRNQLIRAWNDGAALVHYHGHANTRQWAATSLPNEPGYLLHTDDLPQLNNRTRLPILLSATCLSGAWARPGSPPIDTQLLLHKEGGVVAALTPHGSAVGDAHATLFNTTLAALINGENLGNAHLAGIHHLAATGVAPDLGLSMNLLGDPELRLARVWQVWLPLQHSHRWHEQKSVLVGI
jgi:hypothetical protein